MLKTFTVISEDTFMTACGREQKTLKKVSMNSALRDKMENGVFILNGEMPELAEGARLEIVCTPKRCTEGSNPSLSAIFHFRRLISDFELLSFVPSRTSYTFHLVP
jgi:hypothetical protein